MIDTIKFHNPDIQAHYEYLKQGKFIFSNEAGETFFYEKSDPYAEIPKSDQEILEYVVFNYTAKFYGYGRAGCDRCASITKRQLKNNRK